MLPHVGVDNMNSTAATQNSQHARAIFGAGNAHLYSPRLFPQEIRKETITNPKTNRTYMYFSLLSVSDRTKLQPCRVDNVSSVAATKYSHDAEMPSVLLYIPCSVPTSIRETTKRNKVWQQDVCLTTRYVFFLSLVSLSRPHVHCSVC